MYVITGGAGFIGSHLVQALLAENRAVRVVDDFSTGRAENLAGVADDVEVFRGDIRDPALMAAATRGAEVVFHQAALPSVPRSVADPATSLDVNVAGTLNVLLAARDNDVRRVVQASSSSVYGDTAVQPKSVDMRPQPRSPYAVSKLAAETLGAAFQHSYGLETTALRYFNVFGPRQDPSSEYSAVIPKFLAAISAGRAVTVHGDGKQSRDFTYIDNVVRANLLAAQVPEAAGQVFNIATGQAVTVLDVVDLLSTMIGRPAQLEFTEARTGDVRDSLADCTPAASVLGYEPVVDFSTGLLRTVDAAATAPW